MHRATTLFICLMTVSVFAVDESGSDTFYINRIESMRQLYFESTGDPILPDDQQLLQWKNSFDDWLLSPRYKASYERYKKETGLADSAFPSVIFRWELNKEYSAQNESVDDSLALKRRRKVVDDSLYLWDQLKRHPTSKLDFESVPFGVTKRAFTLIFCKRYPVAIRDDYDRLIVDGFPIAGASVDVAFYFGSTDSLQWYEFEGPDCHADSLDGVVRPFADRLARYFQGILGPEDHLYRIGFFDIVQDRLSLYKTWIREKHDVYVGLATSKYRYYARAVVMKK